MPRLFILILLVFGFKLLPGQGIGEFLEITRTFKEDQYWLFIKAAREDGDSTKVVMLKGLCGRALVHQQRYPEAEKVLFEAIDIIKKMPGELRYSIKLYESSILDAYDYLGEYYTQTGDYKRAEYFLKQSEQARNLHFSRGSPHRIFNLQNLSEFYLAIGKTESSEVYLQKLNLELNRTRFNNEKLKSAYGTYYTGMTEVCIRQGRLSEAKYFFRKLVKFQSSPYTSYKGALRSQVYKPRNAYFQSQILMMEGRDAEALQMVDARLSQNLDSLKDLPMLLQTKAIVLYRLGRIQEALTAAQTLLEIHIHNINKVFNTLSEGEKETLFNRTRDDFDIYNSLVIAAIDQKSFDATNLESIMNFRLATKALLLNNSLKIRQSIYASGDTALIHDYRTLSSLKNKVSREVFRKSSKREMGVYEDQIKSLEKSVSRQVAKLSDIKEQRLTCHDLQLKMDPQEVAVEIIRVRKLGITSRIKENNQAVMGLTDTILYFPIVISRERMDFVLLRDGNAMEDRFFKLFKNEVQISGTDTTLYHVYWSPIGGKVHGFKTVYLSPDGVYNRVNINILLGPAGYVEDKTDLVMLSNLKDLTLTETVVIRGRAIFFGQPNFELSRTTTESDTKRDVPNFQLEAMKETDFKSLPGTKDEIENGARVLTASGWSTQSFLGDDATENNLKTVNNPALLHIATHGFFVEGSGLNPMLRSGLILSGVKSQDEFQGEDGVLTAYEASSLPLDNTKLVVLSACETGSGEIRTGEGVYGLQRAFLIAGANHIIMSLWKVDDKATEKLMTLFYTNLAKQENIRASFVDAQRTLRKEYPEPFYWGAFILIGK